LELEKLRGFRLDFFFFLSASTRDDPFFLIFKKINTNVSNLPNSDWQVAKAFEMIGDVSISPPILNSFLAYFATKQFYFN